MVSVARHLSVPAQGIRLPPIAGIAIGPTRNQIGYVANSLRLADSRRRGRIR